MGQYSIRYAELQSQATGLQNIGKSFASLESRLNSIASKMDTRDKNMATLRTQIRSVSSSLQVVSQRAVTGATTVRDVGSTYLSAEKSVYSAINGVKATGLVMKNARAVGAIVAGAVCAPCVGTSRASGFLGNISTLLKNIKDELKPIKDTFSIGKSILKYGLDFDLSKYLKKEKTPDPFKVISLGISIGSGVLAIGSGITDDIACGKPASRIIGNSIGEASHQAAKIAAKEVFGKLGAKGGAAIGQALGLSLGNMICPVVGGYIGGVLGATAGAYVGAIAGSAIAELGVDFIFNDLNLKQGISDVATKASEAVGVATKSIGKAIGSFFSRKPAFAGSW